MTYHQLTENERYQIYALIKNGTTRKECAAFLNRSESTISRELRRNQGLKGYRPQQAHQLSDQRRRAAKKAIKVTAEIEEHIHRLIRLDLSPQQVVDYLRNEKIVSLHHETIYQMIYAEKKWGNNLHQHLRIASKAYRKRYGTYDRRGKIVNRRSIDDRPAIVDQRSRVGDWEGDTVIGKNRCGALLTLVERKTLYTVIVKLEGKNAQALAEAAIMALHPMREKIHTITFDNGLEFAAHEQMAMALEATIYFAHPYASWERGTNENMNGLIRQYFPKGMGLSKVTQQEIDFAMERLNNRPRASRNFKSPNELLWGRRVDLLAA